MLFMFRVTRCPSNKILNYKFLNIIPKRQENTYFDFSLLIQSYSQCLKNTVGVQKTIHLSLALCHVKYFKLRNTGRSHQQTEKQHLPGSLPAPLSLAFLPHPPTSCRNQNSSCSRQVIKMNVQI